ncbi:MAG: hypothetical protein ACYS1C_09200 [Planctomycetota bacterium]|jgi:hypothetical protein
MTRQCTLYVVRRTLHECPETAEHPVSRLLWTQSREGPVEEYTRLSFLHNLGLFLPLELPRGGDLPGSAAVPAAAYGLIRTAEVAPTGAAEGTEGVLEWLAGFIRACRAELARALAAPTR